MTGHYLSSSQQADAGTIASQVTALRERIATDGGTLLPHLEFIDQGYSGGTFVRPGLARLRDAVYAGGVDRLYVLDPDRLARKYASQVVVLEEFQRAGVEVIFLHHPTGQTPEAELLLQIQGMMAEYERAKILERTRRGKRHAAIEEVCRRLERRGAVTRSGKTVWNRSTVGEMLNNPADTGAAPFGRTRLGEPRPRLRPVRGHSGSPKRPCSIHVAPSEDWIRVPVPALVSREWFQAVQEQLHENRQRIRQRRMGNRYLLQGLVVCRQCGYGFHGRTVSSRTAPGPRYFYYRCNSANAARRTGAAVCKNPVVRGEQLDEAVWVEVCALLSDPYRLEQEYRRRLEGPSVEAQTTTVAELTAQREKVRRASARLIDSYTDGLIEKGDFEPRIQRLKQRATELEKQTRALADEQTLQGELRLIIDQLEEFAQRLERGLDAADPLTRREIIRAVVRRIEVDERQINIVFKVSRSPFVPRPGRGNLQYCPMRRNPTAVG